MGLSVNNFGHWQWHRIILLIHHSPPSFVQWLVVECDNKWKIHVFCKFTYSCTCIQMGMMTNHWMFKNKFVLRMTVAFFHCFWFRFLDGLMCCIAKTILRPRQHKALCPLPKQQSTKQSLLIGVSVTRLGSLDCWKCSIFFGDQTVAHSSNIIIRHVLQWLVCTVSTLCNVCMTWRFLEKANMWVSSTHSTDFKSQLWHAWKWVCDGIPAQKLSM